MSDDKDLAQAKKETAQKTKAAAAAKAKAAALARKQAKEEEQPAPEESGKLSLADQKAAAAAKAKAAALARKQAKEEEKSAPEENGELSLADQKAAAVAKAKADALARKQAKEGSPAEEDSGEAAKKKAVAAAKAKAAAARVKAKAVSTDSEPTLEATPSINQPLLEKYLAIITQNIGSEALEDSYINKLSKDVPTLVAKPDTYLKIAQYLKYNENLRFDYLSELHGTDFETHMEVYVHLYSYKHHQPVALKVKLNRSEPVIPSIVHLWQGANWPECETYDLLGIKFEGHPDLKRIMLGEHWVGYPLRKDYEPYDVEV